MNTSSALSTSTGFEAVFEFAVKELQNARKLHSAGMLDSSRHSVIRAVHLEVAIKALAGIQDITLASPMYCTSTNNFCITAEPADGSVLSTDNGHFGSFALLLNRHGPTNGLSPVQLTPKNGMCFMSESGVEALVLEQAAARGI